jgi:uncharacterized protein (DUF1501 family)
MNRLLAAMPGLSRDPTEALAVGATLPQILKGRRPVANLPLGPAAGSPLAIDKPEIANAFDRLYSGKDAIGQAYRQGRMARAELIAGLVASPEPADSGAPAPNGYPAVASRLAGLMSHNRKIRVVVVSLGGWDTHVRQGNHTGQLAERLRPLGDGLAAFAEALGPVWQDTAVVVLSEFGRTVRENGDGGTDHGHGNVVWVLGGAVRGGRIYGEWPGLASDALYEGRDLAVTTDFRTVLAAVTARHLRVPDRALGALFPGFSPPHSDVDRIIA